MDNPYPELQTAISLWQQKQFGPALTHIMQVIRTHPDMPEAWELAGYFLVHRKKWHEACQLMAAAVTAFPDRAPLHAHYALALDKMGRLEQAYQHVLLALQKQPDMVEALLVKIEILFDAGYYDAALAESLKLHEKGLPETAAFCEGIGSFLTGNLSHGIKLLASVTKSGWRGKPLPEWDGQPAQDIHVILYNSQGFGDLIQFSRYLEKARQRVGQLSLLVPRSMERLMRDSFPDPPLVIESDAMDIPADITHRYSFMSLAALPDSEFSPLPEATPYLRANPALTASWREKLSVLPRPWIGVVWMSPWQMNSPFRVVNFSELKPLIDLAGPHLVSLQMGPEAQQAVGAGLFDASPWIKDFADSAALVSELDLVITLDSAPAHLAGALGKPAWVFLPFSAEWRWLVEREDCIWYPAMRLFRQSQPQGWAEVFGKMSVDLQKFLAGDTQTLKPVSWNKPAPQRHPHPHPLPSTETSQ